MRARTDEDSIIPFLMVVIYLGIMLASFTKLAEIAEELKRMNSPETPRAQTDEGLGS